MNNSVKIFVVAALLLAPTAGFAQGGMHGGMGGIDHSMTGGMSIGIWTTLANKHEVIVQKIDARLLKGEKLLANRLIVLELNGMGNSREAKILIKEIERIQRVVQHNTGTV